MLFSLVECGIPGFEQPKNKQRTDSCEHLYLTAWDNVCGIYGCSSHWRTQAHMRMPQRWMKHGPSSSACLLFNHHRHLTGFRGDGL